MIGDFGEPTVCDDGGTTLTVSAIGNSYLWNGRRYDSESGLYYYRTRYLEPGAGQFTTRDTIGLWGDRLNLGNGRTYVANNPWTWVDPFGLEGQEVCPGPPVDATEECPEYPTAEIIVWEPNPDIVIEIDGDPYSPTHPVEYEVPICNAGGLTESQLQAIIEALESESFYQMFNNLSNDLRELILQAIIDCEFDHVFTLYCAENPYTGGCSGEFYMPSYATYPPRVNIYIPPTGMPSVDDLAEILLHEYGHAVGYGHDPNDVFAPNGLYDGLYQGLPGWEYPINDNKDQRIRDELTPVIADVEPPLRQFPPRDSFK